MSQVTGIGIVVVFVEDYATAFTFYHELLELSDVSTMNDHSCYFRINETQGMYLVGGKKPSSRKEDECQTTFALAVRSTHETFAILTAAGTRTVQTEPMAMNDTDYWFQCYDPSNNIIEFIGEK